jgi:hypothetical protein
VVVLRYWVTSGEHCTNIHVGCGVTSVTGGDTWYFAGFRAAVKAKLWSPENVKYRVTLLNGRVVTPETCDH